MIQQITIEEALKLVSFRYNAHGEWEIGNVDGNVNGNVNGYVWGDVGGNVYGNVDGYVGGDVGSNVHGNVNGHVWGDVGGDVGGTVEGNIESDEWQRVKTPRQKLKRLIEETNNSELIDLFKQLENN